jgi:Fe2+ transport system protein FeoA
MHIASPLGCVNKPLSILQIGASGRVVDILPGSLSPKLVEMGLHQGCLITVLYRAPFNGPLAIDLGASVLSLRMDEADLVMITDEND